MSSLTSAQASGVKTYCLTFGVQDVNISAVVRYLYDSNDVIAFWNYVPLVYCIKSRLTSSELALKLQPFFPRGTFFVAEVNVYNVDGSIAQCCVGVVLLGPSPEDAPKSRCHIAQPNSGPWPNRNGIDWLRNSDLCG